METIELARLAEVVGGEQSTAGVSIPGASVQASQSDYAKCVDNVVQQTAQQYPPNKGWNPFGPDANAGPRATATMKNMRDVCGLPPG